MLSPQHPGAERYDGLPLEAFVVNAAGGKCDSGEEFIRVLSLGTVAFDRFSLSPVIQ